MDGPWKPDFMKINRDFFRATCFSSTSCLRSTSIRLASCRVVFHPCVTIYSRMLINVVGFLPTLALGPGGSGAWREGKVYIFIYEMDEITLRNLRRIWIGVILKTDPTKQKRIGGKISCIHASLIFSRLDILRVYPPTHTVYSAQTIIIKFPPGSNQLSFLCVSVGRGTLGNYFN